VLKLIRKLVKKLLGGFIDFQNIYVYLWKLCAFYTLKEKGLLGLRDELKGYVEDISEQYTRDHPPLVVSIYEYLVRTAHVFQMEMLFDAVNKVLKNSDHCLVGDIGDSAGTHMTYLREHYSDNNCIKTVSINLDPVAVKKYRKKDWMQFVKKRKT
jgi:hypothetical protein